MNSRRFMTTVMCDDVRREEGNKLSYMGIYGSNLVVPSFPITLPKLCFVMSVMLPAGEAPPKNLTFRLFRDEDILSEIAIPENALEAIHARVSSAEEQDSKRLAVSTVLQLFPLQLPAPCALKARAVCDDEELKGGVWTVEKAT